jgi:hypothetical protein
MLAYKIYTFDIRNGYELIGILPERRGDLMRITRESVIKWGRMLLDCNGESKSIIIIKPVRIDSLADRMAWFDLPLDKHQEVA